jgi:hypothetical protein
MFHTTKRPHTHDVPPPTLFTPTYQASLGVINKYSSDVIIHSITDACICLLIRPLICPCCIRTHLDQGAFSLRSLSVTSRDIDRSHVENILSDLHRLVHVNDRSRDRIHRSHMENVKATGPDGVMDMHEVIPIVFSSSDCRRRRTTTTRREERSSNSYVSCN